MDANNFDDSEDLSPDGEWALAEASGHGAVPGCFPRYGSSSSSSESSEEGAEGDSPLNLTSLFECPVCFDYVLPPILQCARGHLICSFCRARVNICPTCRGQLSDIRNLAMEKLARSIKFPCRHSAHGCTALLKYSEKLDHDETCVFRPWVCPFSGLACTWQGTLSAVKSHIMTHNSISFLEGENTIFLAAAIDYPATDEWVAIQTCFGHHFMLVLEKKEKYHGHLQFFALVLFIGPRNVAQNFAYVLKIKGGNRHLSWGGVPRSIRDGIAPAIHISDCLVFDASIAERFSENGNLTIYSTISMA